MSGKNELRTPAGRKKRLLTLGVLLIVLFGLLRVLSDSTAKKIVFHPSRYSGNFAPDTAEEVSFRNSRNEMLYGHYFSFAAVSGEDSEKGSIIYCHGNGGDITNLSDIAMQLRNDLRCNVLVFDYAGYGKSEGRPTLSGILDDAKAARNWLAQKDGIPNERVVVYGHSLGGAVAVDLAVRGGARALVVESSFTSLGDMGRIRLPYVPVDWLLRERLASVDKIGRFQGPVFISHGKADEVIPFSQGKRLFDAANEPKTFYVPPEGADGHSSPLGEEHRTALREFFKSLP